MAQNYNGLGKLALIIILLWLFYEILKAGVKGQDTTIHRCGNCNMVLRSYQTPCPNCGYNIIWN